MPVRVSAVDNEYTVLNRLERGKLVHGRFLMHDYTTFSFVLRFVYSFSHLGFKHKASFYQNSIINFHSKHTWAEDKKPL